MRDMSSDRAIDFIDWFICGFPIQLAACSFCQGGWAYTQSYGIWFRGFEVSEEGHCCDRNKNIQYHSN